MNRSEWIDDDLDADLADDGECGGCTCFLRPPCHHCTEHVTEDPATGDLVAHCDACPPAPPHPSRTDPDMTTSTASNGDLTFTVPASELPVPGEVVEYELAPYLTALIANTNEPVEEVIEPTEDEQAASPGPLLTYEVVDVIGATRTHAAVVRRRGTRTVVNRYTLCSVTNSRRVRGRRRDQELSTVTCAQCRRRLEAEGEL